MSDVFISYAHEDAAFVDRLRAALAARGREVWVDTAGIEPADQWRLSAHEAIERSDALLFVISAHSLRSDPSLGELDHAHSLNKRVIPVCVDEAAVEMDKPKLLDELSWIMMRPTDDFEAGVSAIIRALDTDLEVVRTHTRILVRAKAWELAGRRTSPLLRGEELRVAEQWLARATASGSPPIPLQQDFIAASRRAATRRIEIVAAVFAGVAVIAVALSIFALIQRSHAIQQATLATSRQLAAVSESALSSNLKVGLLLAVRAYRTNPNPQTRSALLQADLYSPRLARFLPMGGSVSTLAGSDDRSTVVAGLSDGRVLRRDLARRGPMRVAQLGASVTSVAVSRDGGLIAAADGSTGVLWRAGAGASPLQCPAGQGPAAVGVSPSGRIVVVHCQAPGFEGAQSMEVVDGVGGGVTAVHPLAQHGGLTPSLLVASSDTELLMLDGGYGLWQRRRIPDWSLEQISTNGFGVHQGLFGYSSDGRYITASNGDPTIPVWPTAQPTNPDPAAAPLTGQAPIGAPTALSVSPGGTALAVADSGTIYVAPLAAPSASHALPQLLTGNGAVNRDGVRFFGDGSHLLSASGDTVAVWDLTQLDRLAKSETSSLQSPCNGCGGAFAAVSLDGRKVAAVADGETQAVVQALEGNATPELMSGYDFGPPMWDGNQALLPLVGSSTANGLPADVHALPAVNGMTYVYAAALSPDRRIVTLVDQYGDIYVQDPSTGAVEHRIKGPRDLRGISALPLQPGMAAIDPAARLVAIVDNGVVLLTDFSSGRQVARLGGTDATYVGFTGGHLLVQRKDGSLEVWDARASAPERTLAGDQNFGFYYPVADPGGELVARQRSDGSITLADLRSGNSLGTISAPGPASLGLRLGLTFSADGGNFITVAQAVGSNTSLIIQRDITSPTLVRAACAAAGATLTAGQWRTYVGSSPPGNLACK